MRLSKYYLPTIKEIPTEADIISHQYSLRSGLIKQTSAGIYTWLPLGNKVLSNIQSIIRQKMDNAGNIEILMPCIQPAELWKKSGRYEDYGREMLRIKDRHNREMLFSPTHEEMITYTIRDHIRSYKELPRCFYQMQWKFRDEIRPRFGVMRGREFLMKDAYSFDINKKGACLTYEKMYNTYIEVFKGMGLKPVAVKADAGPIGGDLSHEFHVFANTGESIIYYDRALEDVMEGHDFAQLKAIYTAADDLHDPQTCPIPDCDLKSNRAIEVGHIFYFGTKYSNVMDARVALSSGELVDMHMGSYGIGVSRLVGAIIEANHDERGIIWPQEVAPFKFGLINLSSASMEIAENIYRSLDSVLFDDTGDSVGVKFARMDLIGLPWQIIIGKNTIKNDTIEIKNRKTGIIDIINMNDLMAYLHQLML